MKARSVKRLSRVLAAVDFSKAARGAFDYALALSTQHGADLIAIQAVPLNQPSGRRARQRRALADALWRRAEQAGVTFIDRVQVGDPAEIVLLHARALRPDVIVTGTHQRRGVGRIRTASVAERIAAKATVPVLVVPWQRNGRPVRPFKHLAVAVDFSAASDRAVHRAMTLATQPGDRITLLHVVPGYSSETPRRLRRSGLAEYQRQMLRDAWQRLQFVVPPQRDTAAAIHARVLAGDTTDEIVRAVRGIDADLLLVGVPKRGILSRAIFGTTAARLLRVSGVPVLAVPATRAAARAARGRYATGSLFSPSGDLVPAGENTSHQLAA